MLTNRTRKEQAGGSFGGNSFLLYQQLKKYDPAAIRYLHFKTLHHLQIKRKNSTVMQEDIEELANDAVLLALQKIRNGTYSYQGFSPVTFTLLVADNLLRNFQRKKRRFFYPLEGLEIPQAPAALACLAQQELEQKVEEILATLSPVCQKIIQLKYFDGLRDEEIVERQLTSYRTVDSLKSKRCALIRKLRESLN